MLITSGFDYDHDTVMIYVAALKDDVTLFYNDKKPWWKTKRARWFIRKGYCKLWEEYEVSIEHFFVRVGKKGSLIQLKDYEHFKSIPVPIQAQNLYRFR